MSKDLTFLRSVNFFLKMTNKKLSSCWYLPQNSKTNGHLSKKFFTKILRQILVKNLSFCWAFLGKNSGISENKMFYEQEKSKLVQKLANM